MAPTVFDTPTAVVRHLLDLTMVKLNDAVETSSVGPCAPTTELFSFQAYPCWIDCRMEFGEFS